MEFQVKFCHHSGLRLWRTGMLFSTKSKCHKSKFRISWMYRYNFYDLKAHSWWPNKCLVWLRSYYFLCGSVAQTKDFWRNERNTQNCSQLSTMLYSERGNSGKFENWKDFLSLFFKVALTLITLWVEAKAFFKIFSFCFIGNTNLQTNRRCNVWWWIVTVFVTWERSQRKIRKFLLPILTNRWSALASIGLYRKPQKQRGSMGTECCFCCIFLNAKPMMNWHLPPPKVLKYKSHDELSLLVQPKEVHFIAKMNSFFFFGVNQLFSANAL